MILQQLVANWLDSNWRAAQNDSTEKFLSRGRKYYKLSIQCIKTGEELQDLIPQTWKTVRLILWPLLLSTTDFLQIDDYDEQDW